MNNVVTASAMPHWRSYKVVSAAPIESYFGNEVRIDLGGTVGRYLSVTVPPGCFIRYTPVKGDYLVIYDDGYTSVSPKAAFEAGYSRV